MNTVIGVSLPGSGHQLLLGMLKAYFGPEFHYGRDATEIPQASPNPHRWQFIRNDSLDLIRLQIPDLKYLIQYRSFDSWIVSVYDRILASHPGQTDSSEGFGDFVSHNFTHYRIFMDRWVFPDMSQNQLVLSYEQLVHYPLESLQLAIWWLDSTHEIDASRLRGVISDAEIRLPASLQDFRHYDPELFDRIGRLSLTREEVRVVCLALMGREPAQKMWLRFQSHDSVEQMVQIICDSPEYKNRMRSGK